MDARQFLFRRMPFLVAGIFLAGLAAACGGGGEHPPRGSGPAPATAPGGQAEGRSDGGTGAPGSGDAIRTFSTDGWKTDFSRHTINYDEISSGGPPKDGIPAIDAPKLVSIAEADRFLGAREPVAALELGGEARAYPLQILIWHEIVNDVVGDIPVVATYCPLCNTALAFRRAFDGRVLDFGTTGNLRFSDLVMYDRQTESWWQQIGGEGIAGEYAGRKLETVPTSILSYADFKAAYPGGRVLSRDTGYRRGYGTNPYTGYDTSSSPFLYRGPVDGRLAPMERVVSIVLNDEAAAYPFKLLASERVANDQAGGEPVAVFFKPGTGSALDAENFSESRDVGSGVAFRRTLDGKVLAFRPAGDAFVDEQTGSRWNVAGQAVSGPLSGRQLELLPHANHFWFAWVVFRPDTRIYSKP